MILIVNKYILARGFKGVSLWPFVIIRDKIHAGDNIFLNHERIHLRQQQELLIFPFYVWYMAEYFLGLLVYQNTFKAYRNISFEREAYINEENLDYCKTRKFWSFTKYIVAAR